MLSTIHQRSIRDMFEKEGSISLDRLKTHWVDTGIMNLTTLYRILDRWKASHIIYEVVIEKNRIFIYCDHQSNDQGIRISYCQWCQHISEEHFPLPIQVAHAETIEYIYSCERCSK